jgi:hypothetical protein
VTGGPYQSTSSQNCNLVAVKCDLSRKAYREIEANGDISRPANGPKKYPVVDASKGATGSYVLCKTKIITFKDHGRISGLKGWDRKVVSTLGCK